jgi:hypothetical protein
MQRKKRKLTLSKVIVIVTLPLLAVAVYFAAYFATARRLGGDDNISMGYDHQWQAQIFKPAAFMESILTRKRVTSSKIIHYLN